MSKTRKTAEMPSGIGFVSLMTFFTVMAFVAIGVISLTSAVSDSKMVQQMLEKNDEYYSAYSSVQKKLSENDKILCKLFSENNYNRENILNAIDNSYSDSDSVFFEEKETIDDNRYILMTAKINMSPAEGDKFYSVIEFKTIVDTDIYTDEHIPVME